MSSESNLFLRSVAEIAANKLKFFIPDYQRGFRWEKEQVEDLLTDLVEFFQSGKPLYCLQPLVVMSREGGEWEVVDGQQRLTTLFLILSQLSKEAPKFEIRYQRHEKHFEGSSHILSDLHQRANDAGKEIPDLHYIGAAASQIEGFLKENPERRDLLQQLRNPSSPQVSFIWYQLPEKDAVAAFTRLNAGKIPLTDVELIRALFLRGNTELSIAERLKIATGWDQMEKRLNEGEFWSFAAPVGYTPENRIELLFQIEAGRLWGQQDHELFRHVKNCIEGRGLRKTWVELEQAFATLEEWYEDHALFHLIGYLSNAPGTKGTPVWDLYRGYWLSGGFTTKDGFSSALKGIIKKQLIGDQDIKACLDGLEYPNAAIKPLLLCFNLAALMSERQGTVRFSFHAFQDQNWDVEHIHARATSVPEGKELDGFLEMYLYYFTKHQSDRILLDELKLAVMSESRTDASAKSALYKKCLAAEQDGESEDSSSKDDRKSLENLTLLDSKTNRGYKNASYKLKRAWILGTENQNIYIPPCTRNVFTKSYSSDVNELRRWSTRDGNAYVDAMAKVLNTFFQDAALIERSKIEAKDTATSTDSTITSGENTQCNDDGGNPALRVKFQPKESVGFLDLLEKYGGIEIPLIQRDYAQGRESQATVRDVFLNSIFTALNDGDSLNLDFVYGTSTDCEVFYPIDGQQRLTTLFLLHWVAFWKMGKLGDFQKRMMENGVSSFRYSVRPGAERFFPALLKWNPPSGIAGDVWFQNELPKQIWFLKNWLNDPTVRGALVMLDSIKEKFKDFSADDLESRLGKIEMEILVLPKGMPADEIYLKMNARGKPLTDFEKFKAWMVRPKSPLKRDDWKLRLDREWLEFFWGNSKNDKHRASAVSACFFNTMLSLAINAHAGREPNFGETGEVFADRINGWIKLGRSYREDQWKILFDAEVIHGAFASLDEFHKRTAEILNLMRSGDWISKENQVIFDPDPKLSFTDRCWLHAITLFCHGKCGEDREWFRVVRNLISNTALSNIIYLPQTIRSLDKLAERMKEGVLAGLASLGDDEIQIFIPKDFGDQLREERTKAQLLRDPSADWEVIRTAESHSYLKGQIEVLLSGSTDDKSTIDAAGFSNRWETFKVLMDSEKMNPSIAVDISDPKPSERLDRLVIRAVLARCEPVSSPEVWLPWMAESSWGEALKRNADMKQFRVGLMKVIDELIGSNSNGRPDQLVKGLDRMASSPAISSVPWMRRLIEHGEEILRYSEDWKLRRYTHWRSGWESAFFVFQKTIRNRYDLEDILIGEEFDVRNDLLAKLVETGWAQTGASKMTSNGRKIFRGHHPEMQRDGRKMIFYYQSIELDVDGPNGQKERVHFMKRDCPREIQDVLDDLTQHGIPI